MLSFYLCKVGLILSPCTPGILICLFLSDKLPLPFQKAVCISVLPHTCHITRLFQPSLLDHPKYVLVRNANPEASDYTVLSIPLLLLLP